MVDEFSEEVMSEVVMQKDNEFKELAVKFNRVLKMLFNEVLPENARYCRRMLQQFVQYIEFASLASEAVFFKIADKWLLDIRRVHTSISKFAAAGLRLGIIKLTSNTEKHQGNEQKQSSEQVEKSLEQQSNEQPESSEQAKKSEEPQRTKDKVRPCVFFHEQA